MVWDAATVKISSSEPMPPGKVTTTSLCNSIISLRSLRLSHGISTSRFLKVLPPFSTSEGTTPIVSPPLALTALPMQFIKPILQPPNTRLCPFSAIHLPISSVIAKKSGSILLLAEQNTAIFI